MGARTGRGALSTFELALELVREARLERFVSARYQLESYEEAVAHAAAAGRRGAVKIVFDLRRSSGKNSGRCQQAAGRWPLPTRAK